MSRFAERISFLLLLILGLAPRLLFIARFPTIPVSDFNSLVVFGRAIHDHGLMIDGWFWDFFNPGLPLILSMLFRILPGDAGSVARVATAVACGLLPLLPFLIWRRVLPLWVRVTAGALLAVWPGQVVFSGVVAQDNWVMLPTVALAALAVRTLLPEERAHPVIAGLLMAACVATRPEMLVVVVPLFLAASMKWPVTVRKAGIAAIALIVPLMLLAVYRGEATGHFALSTEHGGVSILGSYVPGSTVNAWSDPYPFIASMLYAVGAGPLLSEYGRQYTKVAGDIASRIAVRDEGSKALFVSLGVNPAKITVTGDPAFDLAPAPDAAALDEVREWKSNGPSVAVCLRTWNFGADSTFSDREIARALDEFLDREGGRLLFVAFEGGDDIYCANRVVAQLRHKDRATVLTRWCSPETIAGILSNASLVLGMRLHSVIFSLAAQVPVVALEYDPKVGALAELVGIRDFTLPFGGLDAHTLSERMRRALRESPRLRELGAKATAEMRVRARQTADIAASLLHEAPTITDYGPDTRDLIGRLIAAQINLTEAIVKKVEECAEAVGQPTVGIRPVALAEAVLAKLKI